MADVLNRTTKQLLRSANTPDYPIADWIVDPDLSSVDGWDSKYWTITGDVVSLMSPSERDAVDQAESDALLVSNRAEANARVDEVSGVGVRDRAMIELHNKRINYLTNRVEEILATLESIRTSSGPADSIRAQVPTQHADQSTENPLSKPASFSLIKTRTKSEAVADYKADISTGNQDT